MKRAGLLFCALFLLLPVVQGTIVEEQITAERSQPMRICSPAVTLCIDAVTTAFGRAFVLMNRGSRFSVTQSGAPGMSAVVNSLLGRVFMFLGQLQRVSQGVSVQDIMSEDLYERLQAGEDIVLIDVRLPAEYEQYHIDGAINIPLQDVVGFLEGGEVSRDSMMVFICKTGGRSYLAAMAAMAHGYAKVYNLHNGMDLGWLKADLPVVEE